MIVCSCNVFSDAAVRACATPGPGRPRTPAEVYRSLGFPPCCGRCASTIRDILSDTSASAAALGPSCCQSGCCAKAAPSWQTQGTLAARAVAAG